MRHMITVRTKVLSSQQQLLCRRFDAGHYGGKNLEREDEMAQLSCPVSNSWAWQ